MTTFDDRKHQEEARFKHDQELGFKVRNRRNKLFGLWIAQEKLGLESDAASQYAKDVVLADFEEPGDDDVIAKVTADLEAANHSLSDHVLKKHLAEFERLAKEQVMSE
ncbi:MAG: DUF1476 domain-containing protein [Pseudomonadota bacterium]